MGPCIISMQYMIIMTLIALMQFVVACVTLSYNDDESRRAIVEVHMCLYWAQLFFLKKKLSW
jgi:hypothetical protein